MDVAREFEKVVIRIDKNGFISPLKEVARSASLDIKISGIGAIEGVHEGTEIGLRGFHDQVVMVCHENKSMKNHTIFMNCICQIGKEFLIICTG